MQKKVRCAIYDRVSTELQVINGLSLDTQKELLTDYALSHGYEIVDYYADEGITARKKLQNRKDFQRLLNDIQQDKIDLVLVTKLDRWFRNVRDYHNTQAILEKHHCNWKTILEDYDTSTADGQLKINIMLAVAQNESDRTSERIKVVFEHKRRRGEHINGRPPYGYMIVNKKLQKDPQKRQLVEDFFHQYFTTLSKRKAIQYVLDHYENPPSPASLDRFPKNEIYCGKRGDDYNYCEPYVTLKQFELMQQLRSTRTIDSSNEKYIFSQLIRCPFCGYMMTGYCKKHVCKDGSITKHKRYRCANKYNRHSPSICITESIVENYIITHISSALDQRIYEFESNTQQNKQIHRTKQLQAELERLNNMYLKGRISESVYDTKYESLERQIQQEHKSQVIESIDNYRQLQKIFTGNWLDLYLELDPEHKNAFWRKIIKEIHLDKETHKISGISFVLNRCSNS